MTSLGVEPQVFSGLPICTVAGTVFAMTFSLYEELPLMDNAWVVLPKVILEVLGAGAVGRALSESVPTSVFAFIAFERSVPIESISVI